MKRRTFAQIKRVDIKTFLQEVGQRDRLVSLSRDMKHVDALAILCMNICAISDEETDEAHITVESSEV